MDTKKKTDKQKEKKTDTQEEKKQTYKKKKDRWTKRKKRQPTKRKRRQTDRKKVKSDFSVSLCPFLNFSTHRHKTQNGHLFDTQTHGHNMHTSLTIICLFLDWTAVIYKN